MECLQIPWDVVTKEYVGILLIRVGDQISMIYGYFYATGMWQPPTFVPNFVVAILYSSFE